MRDPICSVCSDEFTLNDGADLDTDDDLFCNGCAQSVAVKHKSELDAAECRGWIAALEWALSSHGWPHQQAMRKRLAELKAEEKTT